MEEKVRGIVLNSVSYGENDKILSIYTLEKGILSAGIKGVKKAGAKLKFASEPFCFAEFIFSFNGVKRTVIGASNIDSFYPIRCDIKKYYMGAAVLEFIKRFSKEEMISEELFFASIDALKELAYTDKSCEFIGLKYFIRALNISGFGLNISNCVKCGSEICGKVFFDFSTGGFLCEKCFDGKGREINFSTYQTIVNAVGNDFCDGNCVYGLRLIEYYIENKIDDKIKALSEFLKL